MALDLLPGEEIEGGDLLPGEEPEQSAAAPTAPARPLSLDARIAQREKLTGQADALFQQELDQLDALTRPWRMATGGAITHGNELESALEWARRNAPDQAAAIDALREQRHALTAQAEKLGIGQTGRVIGSAVGGVLGSIGGGALGSFGGPVGTGAGIVAGSAAGTGIGSYLGSKFDVANSQDISETEAEQLIRNNVISDVALDAAGNILLLGAGKVLKVAGASRALKSLAARYLGTAGEQAAEQTARRQYVKPGDSVAAFPLETLVGKTGSEQTASRVNQKLTNWHIANDLGIPPDQLTEEGLSALRKREGRAYEAVKALPGRIEADDTYKQALAELRQGLESESFPDVEMGKAARNLITAADRESMTPRDMVEFAKRLRANANKNALAFDDPEKTALAKTQRSIAEELEDLIERHVGDSDPELMQNFRAARQRIAKSYDAERALAAPGEIDARKLGTLAKKRPLSGGMADAAGFARGNPKYAQAPSGLGADQLSNVLTNIVMMTAGGLGGSSHDYGAGAVGAVGGFFLRGGSRKALAALYTRAARSGDAEAARHAARLIWATNGALTGAKIAAAKESAKALLDMGYGNGGEGQQ